MEGKESFVLWLLQLLVFTLCLCHCFWFQFFSIPIESNKDSPTCKKHCGSKHNARCIEQLGRIFMRGPKSSNESFNHQRDHDYNHESREKSSYSRGRTYMSVTNDFLLGNGLRDLQGDNCGGKQTYGLDDSLR